MYTAEALRETMSTMSEMFKGLLSEPFVGKKAKKALFEVSHADEFPGLIKASRR